MSVANKDTRNSIRSTWAPAGKRRRAIRRASRKRFSGALDETGKRGTRTRLLRFAPGVFTTAPFVHDYWEEVFLISGDLIVGNDAQGKGGEPFPPNTYACRPPGAYHGPFKSESGCMLLEIHYYDPV